MKTSNYITISFFVFLFGGVFVLFLSAKIHQRDNNGGLWISEEKKLEPFSVVVAEPGANFHIRIAEYPRMRTHYQMPDTCHFPQFSIRNDSLFIFSDLGIEKPRNYPDVIYVKDLKSIVAKDKSCMSLQEFTADTLSIKLNNASLDAFFDKTKNTTELFSIQAVGSKINLAGINAGNLDVQLNGTELNSWNNSIVSLYGTLTNHSNLSILKSGKINLEADSTSTYTIQK